MPRKIRMINPRLFIIDPTTGQETEVTGVRFGEFTYQLDIPTDPATGTTSRIDTEIEAQITKIDPFVFAVPPGDPGSN